MPRIRTIKPEMFQDEKLSRLEPIDRFVFLGLISMADDAGRLLDNARFIDGFIFPNTAHTSRKSLETLMRLSRIARYTSASGQSLIQIANWERHQRVEHPSKHVHPAPTAQDVAPQSDTESSGESHESLMSDSGESREVLTPRSRTLDLGPRTKDRADQVELVLSHYLTHHPKRRPGEKERAAVEKALERYSVDDLRAAIDGNAGSKFHRDNGHQSLLLIMRDGKTDNFINLPKARDWSKERPIGDDGQPTAAYHEWMAAGCP